MSGTVHSQISDGVCTLRIDNQEKRNALSPSILADIASEISSLDGGDDVRALVITGTGEKAFSSGYDISEFEDGGREDGRELFNQMITALYEYEYPTIAMINGHVFGGAIELIAVCDIRIGVEDALFGIPPAKLGVIYGDRGINQVMNHIGPANTKEMLFTGEPIDAERAADIDLLNHAVERDALKDRTYEIAEQIGGNAPLSLKGMKRVIRALLEKRSLNKAEKEWLEEMRAEAMESEDHKEGVEAFAENREPEFVGR